MTCAACDSLNYGLTCTCGEADDTDEKPVRAIDALAPVASVRYTRTGGWGFARHTDAQRREALEWRGMDGFNDPKE